MKKQSAKNKYIAMKMRKMAGEDRPTDQKLAIAYSYAKKKGL
jgi:hypothetical protein